MSTPRYLPARNSQRRKGRAMTARIVPDFISPATESAAAQAASRLPKPLTIETTAATSFKMNPCICCALSALVIAL